MQMFLEGKVDSADKVRYMTPKAIRERGVSLFELNTSICFTQYRSRN